jgi:DNA-binding MarR family transcriptional regulator
MPPRSELDDLDPLLSTPARLAAVALLAAGAEADFTLLRDRLGLTDGNLQSHLRKLEEAGYVKAKKAIVGRSRTSYRLLPKGRTAFERHVAVLERLVDPPTTTAVIKQRAGRRRGWSPLPAGLPVKG